MIYLDIALPLRSVLGKVDISDMVLRRGFCAVRAGPLRTREAKTSLVTTLMCEAKTRLVEIHTSHNITGHPKEAPC